MGKYYVEGELCWRKKDLRKWFKTQFSDIDYVDALFNACYKEFRKELRLGVVEDVRAYLYHMAVVMVNKPFTTCFSSN